MISWLLGFGVLSIGCFLLHVRYQVAKLRDAVAKAERQIVTAKAEVRHVQAQRSDVLDTRLHRLETSTTLIAKRHDDMARYVRWTVSWVEHWTAGHREHR